MTEKEFLQQLDAATPDVPDCFHQAMTQTLAQIVAEESAPDHQTEAPRRHGIRKRTLAAILVAALLLAAAAVAAAFRTDVLSAFWGEENVDADMRSLIQHDLAETTVGNCTVRVEEAAWDGASFYVLYSITDNTCDHLLGVEDPDHPDWPKAISDEGYQILRDNNVGWWRDGIWIDGMDTDIPGGTTWNEYGGDQPGEMLFYQLWPLGWPLGDAEGLVLSGKVTFSMPIGEKQPHDTLVIDRDQETPTIQLPEKGVVSFTLDTDVLTGVTRTQPNAVSTFPDGMTVCVSEAIFSPVRTYVTLDYQVPQAMLDAYIAENGEGYYNEAGELIWPYGPAEVVGDWPYSLRAVDENGRQLFDYPAYDPNGIQGLGDRQFWYLLPPMTDTTGTVYLAPVDENGQADMARKILLRE